jgi:hypothetical protein
LRREDIAAAIYGKIIFTAVIVALEPHTDSAGDAVIALLTSVSALAIAKTYAGILAQGVSGGKIEQLREVLAAMRGIVPLVAGTSAPTVLFVASHFGWLKIGQAFLLAKISAPIMLFVYGYLLGRSTGRKTAGRISVGAVTAGIGLIVLAVKVLSH